MYISEVIIDGFKSYAQRTVISKWDKEFTAVTGLNGSGKSNILDAICFVLGIKTLQALRVDKLQELIYKKGQAGVTKASVTLMFNNDDKDRSPIGYSNESTIQVQRVIQLGGKTKYLINGHTATEQVVQNLFQSVQLNVNNPHFLIMQGHITKVLNMKPHQFISMIEEAAGTRMYEERKDKAVKAMQKKEGKMEDIKKILEVDIDPRLNELRSQKRDFLELQKIESELENLERLIIAHDHKRAEDKLKQSDADVVEKKENIKELKEGIKAMEAEYAEIDERVKIIIENRSKNNAKYKQLEDAFKEFSKELVKVKTQCDLKVKSINEEIENKNNLVTTISEVEAQLKSAKVKFEKLSKTYEAQKKDYDEAVDDLKKQEDLVSSLQTGMSGSDGKNNGYLEQLNQAKSIASQANTESQQSKLKIKDLTKQLQTSLPKVEKARKQNAALIQKYETSKRNVEKLRQEVENSGHDTAKEKELTQKKEALQNEVDQLTEHVDSLDAELASVSFNYEKPSPDFDRSQVKGLVANLVNLSKENVNCATALEVCAGGRLYNVVVSTEKVGTQILEKGKLKKRVTIIPLNKIQSFVITAEKLDAAKKLAPGKTDLALNLIGFEDEVAKAMEFVFGGTLICKDAETAKLVTFDNRVRLRSVTIDGDTYDPTGTLSGGSKSQSAGILMKIRARRQIDNELDTKKKELEKVMKLVNEMSKAAKSLAEKKVQVEVAEHELERVKESLDNNADAKVIQAVEEMMSEIEKLKKTIAEAKEKEEKANKKCSQIEKEMNELSDNKEGKIKSLKKDLVEKKAQVGTMMPKINAIRQEVDIQKGEVDQLEKEIQTNREQLIASENLIETYREEENNLKKMVQEVKAGYDQAEASLASEKQNFSAIDTEIKELEEQSRDLKQSVEDSKLQMQKLKHEIEKNEAERNSAKVAIERLEREHEWIHNQKQYFGKADTIYDFRKVNVGESRKALMQMKEHKEKLDTKVDREVMGTIDKYEKKEKELKTMFNTVKKDKRKIEDTMESLDGFKRDALKKTFDEVNTEFGQIFSDLLPVNPGSQKNTAKLSPVDENDLAQGVEVKVSLGGVWKEGLIELSGGQRSLVALSLILALLKCKPAPMYILDEIDSALDLSHTQNIGQLFRERFKGSQFIVVSLKEGMFNNANLVLRAKLKNGMSTVERIVQRSAARGADFEGNATPTGVRMGAGGMVGSAGPSDRRNRV
ncbi:Structural maintenance of chromosomes protein 2 [Nowakowskiella sp. JEL0407]|nr:Structural maintenance of chromosomes protein 2 [Nowakowskiella sp. JEL0407]